MNKGKKYPFDTLTYCNIGNPLSFGQKPITFNRQVLSSLFHKESLLKMPYNKDVIKRADYYLKNMK